MRRVLYPAVICIALGALTAEAETNEFVSCGYNLLREFSKSDQWFKDEHNGRKYYEAIFHDLDLDGDIDCVYADSDNHYSDGCAWSAIQNRGEAKPISILDWSQFACVDVYARQGQFYVLYRSGRSPLLTVDCARIYESEKLANKKNSQVVCSSTLRMTSDGCLLYDKLSLGLENEIFSGAAEKIERAYSCYFYGSGLKPKPMAPRCSFAPLRKDVEFENGMKCLLKELPIPSSASTNGVKRFCYTVCLDADNDGDTDCYVSNENASDVMNWTLYLNEKGRFIRAQETIWHNKSRRYGLTSIEPEIRAATNSFYRVVFTDGEPTVVVVCKDDRGYYSQSSRKYAGKFDGGEIMGLDQTIRHPCFYGMERLSCCEYIP